MFYLPLPEDHLPLTEVPGCQQDPGQNLFDIVENMDPFYKVVLLNLYFYYIFLSLPAHPLNSRNTKWETLTRDWVPAVCSLVCIVYSIQCVVFSVYSK